MPTKEELAARLAALETEGLLRTPDEGEVRLRWRREHGDTGVDASSNDYLGLAQNTVSCETSAQGLRAREPAESSAPFSVSRETVERAFSAKPFDSLGAGASRLIHGTRPVHLEVERLVAEWVGAEAGLLFSSGYAANIGALSALLGPGDVVVSDALNHASLIDGIRLSRARVVVTPHLDLGAVRRALETEQPSWVVVESYYSMDGDGPDLVALSELCRRYQAGLYVDEAHSVGLFGPRGAGLCAAAGVQPDVLVAAFGKAVGSHGAVVAGSETVRTWLYNRARSFVFSTAPSPSHTATLLAQLRRAIAADDLRAVVLRYSDELRGALAEEKIEIAAGTFGPILGLVVGSASRAVALASALERRGILAQAVRPPTVPDGAARVRLTVGAHYRPGDPARVAREVREALAALGQGE